ncbi:MAG: methyltransferase domain-containing protein [Flavobacteriales bacterium]|nr:methyltransferase domain-containing protein [Bacteroidota bacterium]MCB9241055.1 methyltransferase domain-containing protein [Flavobacteriales bacterium]
MKITFKEFNIIYQRHVQKVISFCTEDMQAKIAANNVGWEAPYSFGSYLEKSAMRFYKAYTEIPESARTCVDIGGFWGVLPLTLKELGYEVTMTEALKFYDHSFDELFDYIRTNGVEIWDIDPFTEDLGNRSYDFVSVMAVLEHIPDSLNFFLTNVKQIMTANTALYCDVPNIAYYFKRRDLLFGKSPLPDIMQIYRSRVPFIGHHHEFTIEEFIRLFNSAGFRNTDLYPYNYSIKLNLKFMLRYPLAFLCLSIFSSMSEVVGGTFYLSK